ncbi:MAG: T9SS type B sorting domain-containing protein [Bacteroidales bacterium]
MKKQLLSKFLFVLAILLYVANAWGQDTWVGRSPFGGSARKGPVAFEAGGKAYVGTGFDGIYRKDFWEYDPATDTWTQVADLPGPARAYATAFGIDGKGYVLTGYNGGFLGDNWEYNPSTNTWTSRTAFAGGARQGSVAMVIGDRAYVGTGYDGAYRKDFYEYNPSTHTWTARATYPGQGRIYATAFAIGMSGYLGTGYSGTYKNDFYRYDRLSDTWTAIASLTGSSRSGAAGFALNGKGYVALGDDGVNLKKDLWEFNPVSGLWTQKTDLPALPRENMAYFVIGNSAYITCGGDNATGYLKDLWQWTPNACELSVTAIKQNASCQGVADGSINLVATGGTEPYIFTWNNGDNTSSITGLAPGNYSVTVRDANNCRFRHTFSIAEPPALVFGRDTSAWNLARSGGGIGNDAGRFIRTDAASNFYVYGTFSGSATFGSTTLTSNGGLDLFLAKYNNLGTLQWVKQIGGSLDDEPGGLAFDSLGNIYLAGSFRVMAYFGPQQVFSQGESDVFVARYSSSGTLQWVQTGGGIFEDKALAIDADASGSVYVAGYYQGIAGFQGFTLNSSGSEDVFVARYSNSGNLEWVSSGGSASPDRATGISQAINGDIMVTGTFQNTATFGSLSITSQGGNDIFVAVFSRYGTTKSLYQAGGSGDDIPAGIITDEAGNMFIAGTFSGTANFGSYTLTSAGGTDIFVLKMTPGGTVLFATSAGGNSNDKANSLAFSSLGNIYITGRFVTTAQFGTIGLTSAGGSDAFVARLDDSGIWSMARQIGGNGNEEGWSVTTDALGRVLYTGSFENSFFLAGVTLSSQGAQDMMLARLREYQIYIAPTITPVSCEGGTDGSIATQAAGGTPPYSWSWSNGATTPIVTNIPSGTYNLSLTDAKGCTKDTSFVVDYVYPLPTPPVALLSDRNNFCADDPNNITLTAIGGSGQTLAWYTGSCGDTLIGTGTSLVIPTPEITTTYWARWETQCGNTSCLSLTVNVLPLPVAPAGVTASQNTVCANTGQITLTAIGGSGEVLRWYSDACGGTLLATGNPVTLPSPQTTTTYYARWESACGQSACQSVTITALALAQPVTTVTSNINDICYNYPGTITLTATGGSGDVLKWGLSCHGPDIYQGTPATLDAPNVTTTYYVWWENSCGASACDSITITVIDPPQAPTSATVSNPVYCINTISQITLSVNGGTGDYVKWFQGYCGSQTVVGIGNPITITAPTTTTAYYARWENACGFSQCVAVQVSVNPVPTATFTGLLGGYCEDATPATLLGSPLGGTFSGPGITDFGTGVATFNPAAAGPGGPYLITYTYTDANGCFDDDMKYTTVYPLPYVNFTGLKTTYCVNEPSAQLTGNNAPYGGFSGPGITSSSSGVGIFNPSVAGVGGPYSITYTYTSPQGCSNSIAKQTSVTGLPNVSFTGLLPSYCVNSDVSILTGNHAPEGYFSGAGIVNIGFGQAVFDPSLAGVGGPYTITYTYTDPNGCTNTATLSTVVNNLPEVNFSGLLGSYCTNSSSSLLIGNMAPGGTFSGPGITDNGNGTATFDPSAAGAGTHTITFTYTDPSGCQNSYMQTTTVNQAPNVDFTGLDLNYCPNMPPATLVGNFAPFGTFSGPGIANFNNGTAQFNPATAGVGGPYNISYTYQALNGCSSTMVKTTTVNPLPSVSFTGLTPNTCLNTPPIALTGNFAPAGHFGGPGITDNNNGTATFNAAQAGVGTHTVYYFYFDANACADTAFLDVTVYPLPVAVITDIQANYCINGVPDTITGNFAPLGEFSGPGITDLLTGQAIFNPAAAGVGGPYNITYTVIDFNGCANDTTYQVNVLAKPTVDFSPLNATYCINATPVQLTGNHAPSGSFSGPGITDQGNGTALFDPSAAGPGIKAITYSFTDPNGCYSDTTKVIQVIPLPEKPTSVFANTNNFCSGSINNLFIGVNGGSGDTVEVFTGSCGGTLAGQFEPPLMLQLTAPTDTTIYYARWVNSCGESECDSLSIHVIPLPQPPASLMVDTNDYCAGTVNILTLTAEGGVGSTLKWWKNYCQGVLVGQGQPLIITAPQDTTWYWATWQNICGISTCDSIRVNVTPHPLPPIALSVDTSGFCRGTISQITLSVSGGLGDTLTWFKDACGTTPIGTGTSLTLPAPDSTTTYYANWKNKCGTSACVSITVEVIQLPEPPQTLFSPVNNYCEGTVSIIYLYAFGGSGTELQWFKGSCNGTYQGSGSPLMINAPQDTTKYFARWVNSCGASACDSIQINVYPKPRDLDSVTVSQNNICASFSGDLTFTAYGTFWPFDQVVWYADSCGGTPVGIGNTITIPAPDTTTIYYARNANACDTTPCVWVEVFVNEPVPPTAASVDPLFICYNDPDSITLSATGGYGDLLVWYTDGCGTNPVITGTTAKIPSPDTTTTYYARWENVCGQSQCTQVTAQVIQIPIKPDTLMVDTSYYCVGSVDYINLTAIGGYGDTISPWGQRVRWFIGSCNGTSIGTGTTLTIPAPIVSKWYYARWENACGVSECDSMEVVVHTARKPDSITADTNNYCMGAVSQLTLVAHGGYGDRIVWRRIDSPDTIPIGVGDTLKVPAPQVTTEFLARWETYCGPSAWQRITIKVNTPEPPTLLIPNNYIFCSDDPGDLVIEATGGNGDSLRWFMTACGAGALGVANPLIIPSPEVTTTYYARYENVCGISDCVELTINVVPAPVFTFPNTIDSVCEGLTYAIQGVSASRYDSLYWTINGPGKLSAYNITNPVYDPEISSNDPVTAWLKLNIVGNSPCGLYTDSIKITINPKPGLSISPETPALCRDSSLVLTPSGAKNYRWIPRDYITPLTGSSIILKPPHTMDYQLEGTSGSGCKDTLSFEVLVRPTPYVNLGPDLNLFACDPIVLDAGGGDGSTWYEWQDGSQRRTYTVTESGTYWVRAYNEGCEKRDTIAVELCSGIISAPNAFSPNNDGINDIFYILSTDETIEFHLYIYDRHGQLVFQTDDIRQGWDGKVKGTPAPPDIYVYLVEYKGKGDTAPGGKRIFKGQVTLIR